MTRFEQGDVVVSTRQVGGQHHHRGRAGRMRKGAGRYPHARRAATLPGAELALQISGWELCRLGEMVESFQELGEKCRQLLPFGG